jgi:ABC-2 type transport system permease protein
LRPEDADAPGRRPMIRTLRAIVRKELIQLFRDKRMYLPLFIAPVIQLILFGYAASVDVRNVPFVLVDRARTEDSRALAAMFTQSGYFSLRAELGSEEEIDPWLQKGEAWAALVVPEDFSRRLGRGEESPLQVILDGSDANTATIVQNYVSLITAKFAAGLLTRVSGVAAGQLNFFEPRIWYNPELRSSFWMVPGVLSLVLLISTLVLTAMAITKEREFGTLEQIIVSPIRPIELILGKTIPFVFVGIADIVLVLTAAKLVFQIPIRGSLAFLFACAFVFILTTLGLGMFFSTISRTQGQVIQTAIVFLMPAMLLSGIFSPIANMPKVIQAVTYLNPLRYYGAIVRNILLKGNGPAILWREFAVLAAMGVLTFTLSALRFRKHLE